MAVKNPTKSEVVIKSGKNMAFVSHFFRRIFTLNVTLRRLLCILHINLSKIREMVEKTYLFPA